MNGVTGRRKSQTSYVSIPVERHQELSRAAYWLNRYRDAIDQPGEPTMGNPWVAKLIRTRQLDQLETEGTD